MGFSTNSSLLLFSIETKSDYPGRLGHALSDLSRIRSYDKQKLDKQCSIICKHRQSHTYHPSCAYVGLHATGLHGTQPTNQLLLQELVYVA